MALVIEELTQAYWEQVRQIYQEGINTGLATFETRPSTWEKWDQCCGFREVGIRRRIAQLHGVWRDTVLLERRSERVGAD